MRRRQTPGRPPPPMAEPVGLYPPGIGASPTLYDIARWIKEAAEAQGIDSDTASKIAAKSVRRILDEFDHQ